jgi:hypothetical protein
MTTQLEHLNIVYKDLSRLTRMTSLHIKRGSHLYGNPWALVMRNEFGGEQIILSANSAKELSQMIEAYIRGYRAAASTQSKGQS